MSPARVSYLKTLGYETLVQEYQTTKYKPYREVLKACRFFMNCLDKELTKYGKINGSIAHANFGDEVIQICLTTESLFTMPPRYTNRK